MSTRPGSAPRTSSACRSRACSARSIRSTRPPVGPDTEQRRGNELMRIVQAAITAAALLLPPAVHAEQTVLRHVPQADLKVLDPVTNPAFITVQHAYMVYDQLFALDARGRPQPQMVETWSLSPDGRTYTFTLRPGLKFHDGTPVRGSRATASIKRWTERDPD